MTVKSATPKTTAAAKPVKKPVARKPAVKTAPALKAAAPVKKVAVKVAAKAPVKAVVKTASPAAAAVKKSKKAKKSASKVKVVRDSFSMPQSDYAKIGELKQLCTKNGMHVKKSELLRAGLHALGKMNAAQLKQAMAGLEIIKTGRPNK